MQEDLDLGKQLDTKIVQVLECRPEIAVSERFTARVLSSLAAEAPRRSPARGTAPPVFGQAAGYVGVVAITIVLTVLTWLHPEAIEAGKGFLFAVELLLIVQLLAVGFWLGMRKSDS